MTNNLLIPKRLAEKIKKPGGGGEFWESFWQDFDGPDLYAARTGSMKNEVAKLTAAEVPKDKDLFVEVVYDKMASAKTTRPKELWNVANLDVVEAKDELTYTMKGRKEDFQKLEQIINSASYSKAKTGENIKVKDKTIFRELYAVSLFSDKSTNVEKRLDKAILSHVRANFQGEIDCIIELYSNQPVSQYDYLFDVISAKIPDEKIRKRSKNIRALMSNMSYRATLRVEEVQSLLSDINFSFINKIKVYPYFIAQRCVPNTDLSGVTILAPQTNEIVGIIDSGVSHQALDGSRFQLEKGYMRAGVENTNHGTFVASRLLFGEDIFKLAQTGTLTPLARFLDVQVMHDKDGVTRVDLDDLQEAIVDMVIKYPTVKIYNVSISNDTGLDEDEIIDLTELIDMAARKYDVLFVFSIGNHHFYKSNGYDEIFGNRSLDTLIAAPSDALNIITVGSISGIADNDCICKVSGSPSPFTRRGGIRGGWKKPELVTNGGNVQHDLGGTYSSDFLIASGRKYGVEGIDSSGLNKDVGTSYSAPIVTRESIKLLDYLKKSNLVSLMDLRSNQSNILKCMLIHSTFYNTQHSTENEDLLSAYGFGFPDAEKVIHKEKSDNVSIVYFDEIKFLNRKHMVRFTLPDYLMGKKLEFLFTLVYNPPVDKNFPKNYNMISLAPSLRLLKQLVDEETGEVTFEFKRSLNPSWNWDNYKNDKFNVINFKKRIQGLTSPYLEVLVQMNVFEEYEKRYLGNEESSISQPYAFVLSIRDLENGDNLRDEMLATDQFHVLLENQIEVGL